MNKVAANMCVFTYRRLTNIGDVFVGCLLVFKLLNKLISEIVNYNLI
jgi:hypothetical protein